MRGSSWVCLSDQMTLGATRDPAEFIEHASCIAVNRRALLIRGASGSGKSSLALELMAFGAMLVADDRVVLTRQGPAIISTAPDAIRGMIEARGLGILKADYAGPARVVAVVDLDHTEVLRLPELRSVAILGQSVPLLHRVLSPHFAAALMQYLKTGLRTDI